MHSEEERERFIAAAKTRQQRETVPDSKGRFTRQRIVEAKFKYPFLRIEETWSRDVLTQKETRLVQTVMVADHLMITLRAGESVETLQAALRQLGGKIRRQLPNSQTYLVETGSSDFDTFDARLQSWRQHGPAMQIVEPDHVVFAAAIIPDDPSFSELWGLHNTGQTGGTGDADIDAPEAWEETLGSRDVVVGVIDTGIDYNHPDLASNIWTNPGEIPGNGQDDDANGYVDDVHGWNFASGSKDPMDDHYHGTHCAGTIGAVGDNGIGVVGVCPQVRMMALKFLSSSGGGTTSDAVEAIRYATANGATLTSNSWGGEGNAPATLKLAIDEAGEADILFVAAAGNSFTNIDAFPFSPASYTSPNIIAVAATGHNDLLTNFSNQGTVSVDLAAPGLNIYSTAPGGTYRSLSGTSMACPHVAGVCALTKARRPALSMMEIKDSVLSNVDVLPGLNGRVATRGRLNAARSVIVATGPLMTLTELRPFDNGANGSLGNNDGIINPGEDIALAVTLNNSGNQPATGLTTVLTVNSTGNRVSVVEGTRTWAQVAQGESVSTAPDAPFVIRIAEDIATPHSFTVHLTSTDAAGHVWSTSSKLQVLRSATVGGRVALLSDGSPLGGATITFTGESNGSVLSQADGTYQFTAREGVYQVSASAPGFNKSSPLAITIPPNTSDVNFALGRAQLEVSPPSVTTTQEEDTVVARTLTLTNSGNVPLNFRIAANPATTAPAMAMTASNVPKFSPLRTYARNTAAEMENPGFQSLTWNSLATAKRLPFADSFESGTLFNWFSGSGPAVSEVVSGISAVGTKSFYSRNTGTSSHVPPIFQEFPSGSRPRHISFWVRPASTTQAAGYVVLRDDMDSVIWFFADDTGCLYVNDDVGGDATYPYQANTWYHVEFRELDWVAKDFDYYVNGQLVKASIPFRNRQWVDEINYLKLHNFDPFSEAHWDDVRLMTHSLEWLALSTQSGAIPPGQSRDITLTFDARDKVTGTFTGQLEISSDDPVNPLTTVPLSMTVVTPPNTPPAALAQTLTINEDSPVAITLDGTDLEGNPLMASIETLPTAGSLYQTADGITRGALLTQLPAPVTNLANKVLFVPAVNSHGQPYASFTFTMSDKRARSASAEVTVNVTSVNDDPLAFNDQISALPGESMAINVLANDVELDGQPLSVTDWTQGQRGSVTHDGSGVLTFTPDASFTSGEDTFTYSIGDGAGGTATASVNVQVGLHTAGAWSMPGRDAAHTGYYPGTLNGQTFSSAWNIQFNASWTSVSLNAVSIAEGKVFVTPDIYHTPFTLSALDLPTGTLAWKRDFSQTGGISGPSYHSGSLYLQHRPHVGTHHFWSLNAADGSTRWTAPFAAQSPDLAPPTVTQSSVFAAGGYYGGLIGLERQTGSQTFAVTNQSMGYWMPAYYNGLLYSCTDKVFSEHNPATGAVNWSVTVSNRDFSFATPAISSGAAFIVSPQSDSSTFSGVTRHLVCVDLSSHTVRWRVTTGFQGRPAVAGSVVYAFNNSRNVEAYNIATGALLRTYTTGLAAIAATVDQPIVMNDTLISASSVATGLNSLTTGAQTQLLSDGGLASLSNGYLVLASEFGKLSCYVAAPGNTKPLAHTTSVTGREDEPLTVTLPGSDANADALRGVVTSLPADGSLHQTADGIQIGEQISTLPALLQNPQRQLIYVPPPNQYGTAFTSFRFKVNDGIISSTEGTLTIHLENVNDSPQAVDDVVYLRAGTTLQSYLPTSNDVDHDPGDLSVLSFTQPARGTVTQNADRSVNYTPQPDFREGTDRFSYTLVDESGAVASAEVKVLVSATNGTEWTQFGNGPDHPGRYPGSLGTGPWIQKWEYPMPVSPSSVVVAGGKVFTIEAAAIDYAHMVALDSSTGGELWRTPFRPANIYSPLSYHRGVVYMQRINNEKDSQVWAVDAADGSVRWNTPHHAQWDRYKAPAVSDLGVFTGGGLYGGLYAFELDSGAVKFIKGVAQKDGWTPCVHDGNVYVLSFNALKSFHPQTGDLQSTLLVGPAGYGDIPNICADEGRAYMLATTNVMSQQLVCVDLKRQEVLWRVDGGFFGTPAVSNGRVYISNSSVVKAYNSSTGEWLADYPVDTNSLEGELVVSNDLLLTSTSSKTYGFDIATRQPVLTLSYRSKIAVADDTVYLACSDKKVRAFGHSIHDNQPPVAEASLVNVPEEQEVTFQLSATDMDGDTLRYTVQSLPASGTLYQTPDGITRGAPVVYAPTQVQDAGGRLIYEAELDAQGLGVGSFAFAAHDGKSSSAITMLTMNVNPANDPPTAIPDLLALRPGRTLTSIRPEMNDRDVDGDTLTVVAFTQGSSGAVTQAPDGSLTYAPATGFVSGTDSFQYTIRDAGGAEVSSTVSLTISTILGRSYPTLGAGPDHTGYVPVILGATALSQRWQTNLGNAVEQLAVAEGRAFASVPLSNALVALDTASGGELWRHTFTGSGSPYQGAVHTPSWHAGEIFVQSGQQLATKMNCLDAATGSLRWQSNLENQWASYWAPAVDDSGVFFEGGYYGGMYGYNKTSGVRLFHRYMEFLSGWNPALYSGGLFTFIDGVFLSHNKATGATLWGLDLEGSRESQVNRTIACADGRAWMVNVLPTIPPGLSDLVCVNLSSRNVDWVVRDKFSGTPAVAHNTVYSLCNRSSIKAYDSRTGDYLGIYQVPGTDFNLSTQPIITADALIVSSPTKTYLFDLPTHALRQTLLVGGEISLAGETLYVASGTGVVSAFGSLNPSNREPVAVSTAASTAEDQQATLTLQGTDPDGDSLRFVIATLPARGSLYQTTDGSTRGLAITTAPAVVSSNSGQVIYVPPPDSSGSPLGSFSFFVNDEDKLSASATVNITVQPVPDAPVACADERYIEPGQLISPLRETSNDYDVDGETPQTTSFTQPLLGSVTRNTDGSLSYQAPAGVATGSDQFTYTLTDGTGLTSTTTMKIFFTPPVSREWSTFGNGTSHTGSTPSVLGRSPLVQRWSQPLTSDSTYLVSATAGGSGRLFMCYRAGNGASRVSAFDVNLGSKLWDTDVVPDSSSIRPPTYHAGRVYAQTSGRLTCLEASTGAIAWASTYPEQHAHWLAPAVSDLGIYIGGGYYGGMLGFNFNGTQRFFLEMPQVYSWTPSIHQSELYTFAKGIFTRHHPQTGKALWARDLISHYGDMRRTPAFEGRRAFLTNELPSAAMNQSDLTCLDLDTHNVLWSISGLYYTHTPAVNNGTVFAIHQNTVEARDTLTGRLLATYGTPSGTYISGQPIITPDVVITSSGTNTYIFGRHDATLLQTLEGRALAIIGSDLIMLQGTYLSSWSGTPDVSFSPAQGHFTDPVDITLTSADPAARIHYTLDGSAPTLQSPQVPSGGTVELRVTGTIRAISVKDALVSEIYDATFSVDHPELAIEHPPGVNLENGATLDFGTVQLGTTVSIPLTLRNVGSKPLHLAALAPHYATISGANDFAVALQPAPTLAPGSSVLFTINFTPSNLGTREGLLTLLSNDEDEGSFTLRLTGRGAIGGEIQFAQSSYPVTNSTSHVNLQITRNGTLACRCALQMNDGTPSRVPPFIPAEAGRDYTSAERVYNPDTKIWQLTFAEGELTKNFRVDLQVDPEAKQNKRFTVSLLNPTNGVMLGPISTTTVELRAPDAIRPTVFISTPSAAARLSAVWPLRMTGVVGDARGIDRVEVSLNGDTPILATLAASNSPAAVPFSALISPRPGKNTLVVTAYDLRGNHTTAAPRTFEFVRRYLLTLASSNATAGSITSVIRPAEIALPPAPGATANPAVKVLQLLPNSSVTLTAKAKPGYVFQKWTHLPPSAVARGATVTFTGTATDHTISADFIASPFMPASQASSSYLGILHAVAPAAASVRTEGMLSGTLNRDGKFVGKLMIEGGNHPISATFLGDGSAWTGTGATSSIHIAIGTRTLRLIHDAESGAIIAELKSGETISLGTITRHAYSITSKVPAALMGGPRSTQALYTLRLPIQPPENHPPSAYPQGDGFANITLSSGGMINLTGALPDGTAITGTSALVTGNAAPLLIQLGTPGASPSVKGGLLTGTLLFDPSRQDCDVMGDLTWFRSAAIGTQLQPYPLGWPNGVLIPAQGAFYNPSQALDLTLGLTAPPAMLSFHHGRLIAPLLKSGLSIRGNIITKTPPQDSSFSLSVLPSIGLFSGTFTPNWPNPNPIKPAFKGILIQKGANQGGTGHFLSNPKGTLTPEAGRVTLGAP